MTAGQHIDYEALQQEAMRGVVRSVLTTVAETGLVGDHHFYIAFNTQAQGASVSKRLQEKYPLEMTIVLQHRYWDLKVSDERFEVKLTFDGIPERLVVPFAAVKVFYDPSVPYGLQFEASELLPDQSRRTPGMRGGEDGLTGPEGMGPGLDNSQHLSLRPGNADREKRRSPRRLRPEKADEAVSPVRAKPAAVAGPEHAGATSTPKPALSEVRATEPQRNSDALQSEIGKSETEKPESGGAKVLDLSKFRKK